MRDLFDDWVATSALNFMLYIHKMLHLVVVLFCCWRHKNMRESFTKLAFVTGDTSCFIVCTSVCLVSVRFCVICLLCCSKACQLFLYKIVAASQICRMCPYIIQYGSTAY